MALHQQRVQADLNERKRHAMEHFMASLQKPTPDVSNILFQVSCILEGVIFGDVVTTLDLIDSNRSNQLSLCWTHGKPCTLDSITGFYISCQ